MHPKNHLTKLKAEMLAAIRAG